ncbi:MAG: ethylbenzene dehydrogenase-related protein [Pirellulales bacterium]
MMRDARWVLAWFGVVTLVAAPLAHGADESTAADPGGAALYAQHCAGCHGAEGDGQGPAARFLFPKPRSFQRGVFKLVSTENNVPSEADLAAVLERGMPGSSMPSWAHLPAEHRQLLVAEIYRQIDRGARASYVANLKNEQAMTDEEIASEEVQEEIREFAESRTLPGEAVVLPELAPSDADAIERGRMLYVQQGCVSCHGTGGKGDGVKQMVDDDGFPTRPRDLTEGIYKGGHDPGSLVLRVSRGMPGTPMPSAPTLTPAQSLDLVHFLRSLSSEERRQAAVLKRSAVVASRSDRLAIAPDDLLWSSVPTSPVQLFPLWWRDGAPTAVQVQAMHDGKDLAIRLTWPDATANTRAVSPEEFEDMAAIQLNRGPTEPFLGMGAPEGQVELWVWRGGREATGDERSMMDDYPFDSQVYHERATPPLPDVITARAVGNPLAVRDTTGSQLAAKGIGSTTFVPRPSQAVSTEASHQPDGWTVVLRRPLTAPGEGLDLAGTEHCSIAIALWDGAMRDRASQKLITMWSDLRLEP